ncbi:hypothetical protein G6L63_08555 [Agrobacterium vitis]|nr:hypothetical protein [Agrobacterium vitis]UJL72878.1 hypothetical protein AVCG412_08660 [Agrobacterium vitis]
MKMRDQIIVVADLYAAHCGVSRKTVSWQVLSRSTKLDNIVDGGDITTGIFERAMQWFSDRWPDDLVWPDGITRPQRALIAEAAE